MATVIVGTDRGVAPHDIFTVYFGGDRDVLADGEAENSILAGQGETVTGMTDCGLVKRAHVRTGPRTRPQEMERT